MENLNNRGKTYEEITFLHVGRRESMASQLVKLGPVRFIEALRTIDIGYSDNMTVSELMKCTERSLIGADADKQQQFSSILMGYLTDEEDWHRILNPTPKAKR